MDLPDTPTRNCLEFRHYDEVLTQGLPTFINGWRNAAPVGAMDPRRHAQELNTIRLDYRNWWKRTDNAIKFLSDMFYAPPIGWPPGRIGVNGLPQFGCRTKLTTARELYESG